MDYSNEEIKRKYLRPPTFEEISEFMKELRVSGSQFERYFSIPKSVIKNVKRGDRNLPVKFWPIIYEKKIPKYGIAYIDKKIEVTNQKKVGTKNRTDGDGHGRLNRIK